MLRRKGSSSGGKGSFAKYIMMLPMGILLGCMQSNSSGTRKQGIVWSNVGSLPAQCSGNRLGCTVHSGRMWILCCGQMWSSSDGSNWAECRDAAWSARLSPVVLSFADRMWIIGGSALNTRKGDIWSSRDGVTWMEISVKRPWSCRYEYMGIVYQDMMWLIGGIGHIEPNEHNEVWRSRNGSEWELVAPKTPWRDNNDVAQRAAVVYENRICVLDSDSSGVRLWYSINGADWAGKVVPQRLGMRYGFAFVAHDNRLWVLGGEEEVSRDEYRLRADAWVTSDLSEWQLTSQAGGIWSERMYHRALSFDGRLWIMGGAGKRDVWSGVLQHKE